MHIGCNLSMDRWILMHFDRCMEMLKTVMEPITQVAKISELRGLHDQLGSQDEGVLLLEGEIHSNMKPGFLRFGSDRARKEFTSLVLTGIRRESIVPMPWQSFVGSDSRLTSSYCLHSFPC